MDVLFSSLHGLFSWTPIVILAFVGTVLYLRRNLVWALPALIVFAAMCWLNGSTFDWGGGAAFGGRRFISVLAAFAPGLALVVAGVVRRPMLAIAPLAAAFVFWNHLLMLQLVYLVPMSEPVRFDTLVRNQTELYLKPPYFYPFAFPANVWFAWREHLPIDRYDLLSPERLRREMHLPLDAYAARFLLDGWQDGGVDAFGARHALSADEAALVVPLDVPAGVPYVLEIVARAEGGVAAEPPILVNVDINGHDFGSFSLIQAATQRSIASFSTPAAVRDRVWRTGYNRLTFRKAQPRRSMSDTNSAAEVFVYSVDFRPQAPKASPR
jgi:hypothetical protein